MDLASRLFDHTLLRASTTGDDSRGVDQRPITSRKEKRTGRFNPADASWSDAAHLRRTMPSKAVVIGHCCLGIRHFLTQSLVTREVLCAPDGHDPIRQNQRVSIPCDQGSAQHHWHDPIGMSSWQAFQSLVIREVLCAGTFRKALIANGLEGTFAHRPGLFDFSRKQKCPVIANSRRKSPARRTLRSCPPHGKLRENRKTTSDQRSPVHRRHAISSHITSAHRPRGGGGPEHGQTELPKNDERRRTPVCR